MDHALIILAAGKGTRMKSDLPKVLHEIGQAPMLVHAIAAGAALEPARVIVITGHGADAVKAAALAYEPDAHCLLQEPQLGTGHAVAQAAPALEGFHGEAVVLYGDTPFIRPQTLSAMAEARAAGADLVVLGFEAADPGRYGRLITQGDTLLKITEFKDASSEEQAINLCNSGVIMADAGQLMDLVGALGNDNAAAEYYLTDIVEIGRARGLRAQVVRCDEAETQGVNSRAQLAEAEASFQTRCRAEALENGVTLIAPETVFFAQDTVIGRDAIIEPNVVFGPGASIETGARIRAFCHIEGAHVSRGAIVGPYARLRPGAELSEDVHIGNFVEVKNATLGAGAKANHLSYLGDASIGAESNIGAGTITCNYDGVLKHRTQIGARAFIGSNTMLVAPVSVGDEAMTGSGSVITADVPEKAMAIGRAKQVTKPGLAAKLRAHLQALKSKRQNEG
ncbi:MAG: bifunctional UDP-N-acetylglucosamine diphosphorylase/glucosamine-1-phosphate N-acetyltransferase GlmU [Mangrovicoccus sp.]|nr:bifunctional UDP-N-acetylglucosamine diphosphorylase/glucosamine-1-phosphate N-acetyltransferase GlmU [Mangrovicoccus sp.]